MVNNIVSINKLYKYFKEYHLMLHYKTILNSKIKKSGLQTVFS